MTIGAMMMISRSFQVQNPHQHPKLHFLQRNPLSLTFMMTTTILKVVMTISTSHHCLQQSNKSNHTPNRPQTDLFKPLLPPNQRNPLNPPKYNPSLQQNQRLNLVIAILAEMMQIHQNSTSSTKNKISTLPQRYLGLLLFR
jgi:hypothetical protein